MTQAIDIAAFEALRIGEPAEERASRAAAAEPEHPMARELRALLANPGQHRIADLARVVDSILLEMTMFRAGDRRRTEAGD